MKTALKSKEQKKKIKMLTIREIKSANQRFHILFEIISHKKRNIIQNKVNNFNII
jgi:hypothetical protein